MGSGGMASARSASLNGGLRAQGRAPGEGSVGSREGPLVRVQGDEAPLKLKAFCSLLLYKKRLKVKDLIENLPRV